MHTFITNNKYYKSTFMKKILYSLFSICLVLSSCASDEFEVQNPSEGNLNISVSIPTSSDMRTRADGFKFSDGTSVNELKCYVYNQANGTNSAPVLVRDIELVEHEDCRGGDLSLDLPTGQNFDVVFLATANPQDNPSSKIYYDAAARRLNVNYDKIKTCDEDVDCFYAVQKIISSDQKSEYSLTLRRPFAQLNIGTKDMSAYADMASSPLMSAGVTVDGVYSAMDLMDCGVVGDPVKVDIASAPLPSGQDYPVSGIDYLTMNYLLVDARTDVDVILNASNNSNSFSCEYPDVPLQRNYQTNIYGNLLTANNDFTVEIDPMYNGSNNKDADDPYSEYDLVLQVSNDYNASNNKHYLNLYVEDVNGNERTISLKQYVDSEKYVKVTWNELGINDVSHIYFGSNVWATGTYGYNKIKSLLKCDISSFHVKSVDRLFARCLDLESVEAIKYWDTSDMEDMGSMFSHCHNLTSLDLSNFNTQNVTNMYAMFRSCTSLETIDISNFNMQNVQFVMQMFAMTDLKYDTYLYASSLYSKLTDIKLPHDVVYNNFLNTNGMFQFSQVENLDLSFMDTKKIGNMAYMFRGCSKLKTLNISEFDTQNVKDMSCMFFGCSELSDLDVSSFDTSEVKNMTKMFEGCSSVTTIDVSKFNTHIVTDMSQMFAECYSLTSLDVSHFDTSNVTTMWCMFSNCNKLLYADVSSFNTSKVTNMVNMFSECNSIDNLDFHSFDTSNVTDMSTMFQGCKSLTYLDLSSFDTKKVKSINGMFENCSNLRTLDITSFDTSNVSSSKPYNTYEVQGMERVFYNCNSLQSLDVSSFNTSSVTSMKELFYYCKSLSSLDLTSFDTSNVTNMENMFGRCMNMQSIDISSFDTSHVINMRRMFYHCESLDYLDVSSFNTSNVSDLSDFICQCNNLKTLEVSEFNLDKCKYNKDLTNYGLVHAFNTANLVSIKGKVFNVRSNLRLRSPLLDVSTVTMLFDGLVDSSDDKTIFLSKEVIDTLTENQISEANSKGWTIKEDVFNYNFL